MSLTSRLANLFNTSPSQQLAPSDETRPTVPFDVGEHGDTQGVHFANNRRNSRTEAMEEEEEARPPYLHVRAYNIFAGRLGS